MLTIFLYECWSQTLVSPCPNLFEYDPQGVVGDRWSGTIKVTLDDELSGIWIRVIFDRPLLELGTDFGEAVQKEPNDFLIRRPSPKVNAGETLVINISPRFDPAVGVPKLLGYRLNAKTVCPLDGVIPPPAPLSDALASPCPDLFSYEPFGPEANVWHGNIKVKTDSELSGVWMRVVLDKPPIHFGTSFGDVVQKEPNEFLVKKPKHKLPIGAELQYRINASFIPGETPPKILGFRLNARTVCPENGIIELPSPAVPKLESPCPNLFTYDPLTADADKWTGTITVKTDFELSGIWMRVILDKEPVEFMTEFGEAVKRDGSDYLIKNPKHKLNVGETLSFRVSARFRPGEEPARIIGFRLNARPVCPENGQIETTTKSIAEQFVSPCPTIFNYEPFGQEPDKWFGNINFNSDIELNGIWLQIILDGRAIQLGNWFGEVNTKDSIKYLIKRPQFKLLAGNNLNLRFYMKFNPNEPIAKLKEIKINGRVICPGNNNGFSQGTNSNRPPAQKPEWVTFAPTRPEQNNPNKPVFGPDFKPGGRPNFVVQNPQSAAQCGTVATKPVALVSHGSQTEEGKWPWHAALYYPNGALFEYYCGGTLISLNHILTVAHCATVKNTAYALDTDDIHVFLGKHQLTKSNKGVQYKQIKKIFVHPDYDVGYYANDIAILLFTSSAEFTDWVRPICLWAENRDINAVIGNNKVGTVVGWGYDNLGRISDKLLQANMPVVPHKQCIWSKREFFSKTVNDKNFCAGFRNGTSVCTGDSGGALVFPRENSDPKYPTWHVRGIVSLSVALQATINEEASLCDTSHFVVFTDVAKFLDWIYPTMNIK